ncbi:MAG: FAD-dependent oxidoreductase [Elusimicrobia bacterium]|nr:FAD-dependent oxidoreductase [Elusimicrobiota bacterium]
MSHDVIVVGGGIIGASAAYALARRGHKVLVMDQVSIPNPQGSSDDHARVFRLTHGKDSFTTDLAARTIPLWKEHERTFGEEFLTQNGVLDLASGDGKVEEASYKTLSDLRLRVERLSSQQVAERYRMIRPRCCKFAVFHPDGGMVWAKRAIEAFSRGILRSRGALEPGVKIVKILSDKGKVTALKDSKGKFWRAEHYVFASGAWTREVLADYGIPVAITRQECLYLRPPRNQGRYRPTHFPVFSFSKLGVHGFPVHIHGFMKIGYHRAGVENRAPVIPLLPDRKFEGQARQVFKDFVPDLADFKEMEGRVHYYTRTPDGDFLLDQLPGVDNAWLAAAFAGGGPMFAPLVGQILSQLVSGEKPAVNLHRFRISRLRLRPKA